MTEYKNYGLITAPDAENLANAVCQNMEDGWQPLGGIAQIVEQTDNGARAVLAQAVVKLVSPVVSRLP